MTPVQSSFAARDLCSIVAFILQLHGAGRWGHDHPPHVFLSEAQQSHLIESDIQLRSPSLRLLTPDAAFHITVDPISRFSTDLCQILAHDLLQLARTHRNLRPLTEEQQRLLRGAQLILPDGIDEEVPQIGLIAQNQSHLSITIRAASRYEAAHFTIDDTFDTPLQGWTTGATWNGWAMPLFPLDAALQICDRLNTINHDIYQHYGVQARHDAENDCIEIPDVDNNPGEWERFDAVTISTPNGDLTVYAVGAGVWTWDQSPAKERDWLWNANIPPSQRVVALVESSGHHFCWRRRDGQHGEPFQNEQQAADDAYLHGATHAVSLQQLKALGEHQSWLASVGATIPIGFSVEETFIFNPCVTIEHLVPCDPLEEYGRTFEESDFVSSTQIPPTHIPEKA